jgi:AAA family ATP:ADP antiporter
VGRFGGAELKAYATALQAGILLAVIPAYSRFASRVPRHRLIGGTVATLGACLVLFWALGRLGLPVGVPFYLWLGVASLIVVAQFWSLANDLYTPEQGERLFPLIAVGGALGAIVGARLAAGLLAFMGIFESMLIAGLLLALYLATCRAAERLPPAREPGDHRRPGAGGAAGTRGRLHPGEEDPLPGGRWRAWWSARTSSTRRGSTCSARRCAHTPRPRCLSRPARSTASSAPR